MPSILASNLTSLLNGLSIGFLLFTLAVGLTLVFGMMDVLNLAHGAIYLAGAYIGWYVMGADPTWTVFLAALGVAAVVGLLAGGALSLLVQPLASRPHLDQALLTLGVALILAELLSMAFGDDVRSVSPPSALAGSVDVAGGSYPIYRLFLIGVGLALAVVVYLVVERTTVGALIRATVADRDMVSAVGVDNRKVRIAVFGAGVALATVAGVFGAPVYGARPGLDWTILILALVVVVVGGLGSIKGALVGALLIGQVETFGRSLFPEFASFVLFGALALVLIARPRGLFGAPTGVKV
ncbi:amino acid/amide ABC transporter membrane protein 1, HAAT family [Haloechinothrix alba]|uniref:Amino acid/amide ABC transporter membrane protein 1, HAAT family n=1 Tax=Haloechinothrix alba TaxID=664784 RepID=A0A238W8G9_9PSEU|nr:branched-chain amino acid ABC transporter permease [Haloechinothrix alba]SNR42850.1 amino acid/amide ABC transporter membrane protein 1, HAAT family [Haloechinothrix alba]